LSSSTQQSVSNNIRSQLLSILQDLPTEMVRRHLLYLSEVLLQGINDQAHAEVASLTEPKPQPATQSSSPIMWLIGVFRFQPCEKLEISQSPSGTHVSAFFPGVPMAKPKPTSGAPETIPDTTVTKFPNGTLEASRSPEPPPAPSSKGSILKDATVVPIEEELTVLSLFLQTRLMFARPSERLSTGQLHTLDNLCCRMLEALNSPNSKNPSAGPRPVA
jgi:hypothetical protein